MKIAFHTLGCKVNSYETEATWSLFKDKGFERVEPNCLADVYIINTCTVTNTADSKSRQRIRQSIKMNPNAVIAVMGCYSQTKKEEIEKIDGVDIIIGNQEKGKIVDLVLQVLDKKQKIIDVTDILRYREYENLNACEFEHTRAFLKIQDGCNNFCSYCIIPFARGPLRSKPHEEVFKEVKKIISLGYKEIVLAGIHTGGYKDNDFTFSDLVSALVSFEGLLRLRISSMEITQIDDKFLNLLKNDHLANHLHLPLQSGSDGVLKRMNRKYNKQEYLDIINKIREVSPDIAISTDLIVGFPGETEEEFQETMDFLKLIKYSKIHVFPFSKRDGTKAALMENQISDSLKSKRVNEVLELDANLQYEYAKKFIGKIMKIIPETCKNGYLYGHTSNYLMVKFPGNEDLIGKIIDVEINDVIFDKNLTKIKKDYLQILGNQV